MKSSFKEFLSSMPAIEVPRRSPQRRFVGLDWAADAKNRGFVDLHEREGALTVAHAFVGISDDEARVLLSAPQLTIGVDTPFGWPIQFTNFAKQWTPTGASASPPSRDDFAWRMTDQFAKTRTEKTPLSVSSDRLALCSRSWMQVLASSNASARVDVGQRSSRHGAIFEVYPAATLLLVANESFETAKFKTSRIVRRKALAAIRKRFAISSRFELEGDTDKDSHVADAFLAALTTAIYAGAIAGWTVMTPNAEQRAVAMSEGWIFLPERREGAETQG
ncbi:MAG: DUF429 domain-containing protein [Archangium sp.]